MTARCFALSSKHICSLEGLDHLVLMKQLSSERGPTLNFNPTETLSDTLEDVELISHDQLWSR
jgi:hypothetical protein